MSNEEKIRLKYKFDIAYFLAIEKLSFRKFPRVCELEARNFVLQQYVICMYVFSCKET